MSAAVVLYREVEYPLISACGRRKGVDRYLVVVEIRSTLPKMPVLSMSSIDPN